MKSAVLCLLAFGFVLLGMSVVWAKVFPPSSTWTAEKAKHLSELKKQVHNLSFETSVSNARSKDAEKQRAAEAEYEKLKTEAEALMAEFQTAHDQPETVSTVLKWSGLLLAGVGIAGWFVVKEA